MKKLLLPDIKKIAVFRALQLGNMLCSIPAMRSLRGAYPNATITLIGLPWAANFVQRFSNYFNDFIHFPGYPGLSEQPYVEKAYQLFLQQVQQEQFDVVLQMQGNGTIVNPMVHQFNTHYVAGFHNKDSFVNSPLFVEYPDHGHEVKRLLKLTKHLGIPEIGTHLEFPILQSDYNDLDELHLPLVHKKYICIHAGSRSVYRQWPVEYFALVADYCADNGYVPVITGTEDERPITSEVIKHIRNEAVDVTGKTSVGALAALLQDAAFLISNCTGVAHIAAALQIPGIIISMDGEPERWGHAGHRVIDWTKNPHLDTVLLDTAALADSLKTKGKRFENLSGQKIY